MPITSANCVFGIASANARRFRRLCVSCSYAYAKLMSLNSLNAVPIKLIPKGIPGPCQIIGLAASAGTESGWNPRGTILKVKESKRMNKGLWG